MRLSRSHRLKRRRLIRPLFDRSRSDVHTASVGCVRVLYRRVEADELPAGVPVQAAFVVGRATGGAVVRNRVRRLMREAYRHGVGPLAEVVGTGGLRLTVLFMFRGQASLAGDCIPRDLPHLLNLISRRLSAGAGR